MQAHEYYTRAPVQDYLQDAALRSLTGERDSRGLDALSSAGARALTTNEVAHVI